MLSGLASLLAKRQTLPDWVEQTGAIGGIPTPEQMKAAAGIDGSGYGGPGPDPAMVGIMASLNGMGNAIEHVPGQTYTGKSEHSFPTMGGMNPMQPMQQHPPMQQASIGVMNPMQPMQQHPPMQQASIGVMQPMQQGFQQVSNQIDNLGDSMNSGFQQLIKQEQQYSSPYAAQQPFPSLPSALSSPFGNSLFGGIAPFLMNQYANGGEVRHMNLGGVAAKALSSMGKRLRDVFKRSDEEVRHYEDTIKPNLDRLRSEADELDGIIRSNPNNMAKAKAESRLKEVEAEKTQYTEQLKKMMGMGGE